MALAQSSAPVKAVDLRGARTRRVYPPVLGYRRWPMAPPLRMLALAALALLATLATGCGGGPASPQGSTATTAATTAEAPPGTRGRVTNIQVGFVTAMEHPYGIALNRFARDVFALSGGRMGIELVPVYAGGDDLALLGDMRAGKIDAGSVSAPVWQSAGVDSFLALQMPFLVTNYALERAVLASPVASEMLEGTAALGLEGLAIHEGGLRKPAAVDGCLLALDDWRGVTMRSVQSDLLSQAIRALGATPVQMPLAEVRDAMGAGRLDALEANVGLVYSLGLYEVLRCMSGNVNLWPFPTVLAMNSATWKALAPGERRVLRRAAAAVPGASIDILTNPASPVMRETCRDGEGYFFFGNATPGELRALRGAVQPVYDRYVATRPTGDFVRRIQAMKASMPPPPPPPPYPPGCDAG